MRLAAIIPALDAERTLGAVIAESRRHMEPVLVVDDGSTDATSEVAARAGAAVIRHEANRGKGAALKSGFAWALENGFDGVITLDADGQHLASEIPQFIKAAEKGDAHLVIGGRAHLFEQMLPGRRFANRFSAWSIARFSGAAITDSQSGFRYYSAPLLRTIELHTDGFDMESEVIVVAGKRGMKIRTIPIELGFVNGLATSHYRPLVDTLRIAWAVMRAKLLW